jgi:cytochrome c5
VSEDKKILNSLAVTIGVLVVIAIIISVVATNLVEDKVDTAKEEMKILERIKPLGELATTLEEAQKASPIVEEPVVAVAKEPATPEQIYNTACMACHASGVAGAPVMGDVASWGPRIGQGKDVLIEHAIKGFKGMPARGGSSQLSDEDVIAAVEFMIEKSQ